MCNLSIISFTEAPQNPCEPSPCGANAVCTQRNGAGACSCLPEYQGNPYVGCRPECVLSSDCPTNKACIRNKCEDPCVGICGVQSQCSVINHVPTCTCQPGYEGDPFIECRFKPIPPVTQATVSEPCDPNPCGPNSICRNVNEQAVCTCDKEYQGAPPNCKPECVISSECPQNLACQNFKCRNPCTGTCGISARCEVINHSPICSCGEGKTGDPFSRCFDIIIERPKPSRPINPCEPSPCGPNSECRVVGDQASCACRANYIGSPPSCRPECVINNDCPTSQACITEKCQDPCSGSCGFNAECRVQNHIPICTCISGYEGDPFTQCSPKRVVVVPTQQSDPCALQPCGSNAICEYGTCTCQQNYFGDPYTGCRPECSTNNECSADKACINLRCVAPCAGTCGSGAECTVVNHIPVCSCQPGTTGDPFTSCRPLPAIEKPRDPCSPSPCGPNSVCRINNEVAVCSCQTGFIGSPPSCRPECIVSAECPLTQACLSTKCQDPCPGTCGQNARCQVVNHNPICSCSPGMTGDPFARCYPIPVQQLPPTKPVNPCIPSPCGPNSECQVRGESPACSCQSNYIGSPPNCRPECTINPECSGNFACINQKCADPCPGSCGPNAQCVVVNHNAVCSCNAGHSGDPFSGCFPMQGRNFSFIML